MKMVAPRSLQGQVADFIDDEDLGSDIDAHAAFELSLPVSSAEIPNQIVRGHEVGGVADPIAVSAKAIQDGFSRRCVDQSG